MALSMRMQFVKEQDRGRYLTPRQKKAWLKKLATNPLPPAPILVPAFTAKAATVSADKPVNIRPSLDGIPTGLRQQIFRLAEEDGLSTTKDWTSKPATKYDLLKLVSKQFYHDLQDMNWQCNLIRKNQIPYMLNRSFFKDPSHIERRIRLSPLYQRFSSLSIEVPLNASLDTLEKIALALPALPLRELKLFFTGSDSYGTPTSLVYCGLRASHSKGVLPSGGQDFRQRAALVSILSGLINLETLVISNANMPVTYSHVILNKPKLRRLALRWDPRTTVTDEWSSTLSNEGANSLPHSYVGANTKLTAEDMPEHLEELDITANSMAMSSRLTREALHTIKKLTWTVPNVKNQDGGLPSRQLNWLAQTAEILLITSMNGPFNGLHTLRICIQQRLVPAERRFTDRDDTGELIYALQNFVGQIVNLKTLELHINIQDQWKDTGLAIVNSIGKDLERLYISEKMVGRQHLRLVYNLTRQAFKEGAYCRDKMILCKAEEEDKRTDRIVAQNELSFLGYEFSVDGMAYRVIETTEDQVQTHRYEHYRPGHADGESYTPSEVDECSIVADQDPFCHAFCQDNEHRMIPDTEQLDLQNGRRKRRYTTSNDGIELLRLNGRLLDRERNKHLFLPADAQIQLLPEDEVVVPAGARPARRFPVIVAAADCGHWMSE